MRYFILLSLYAVALFFICYVVPLPQYWAAVLGSILGGLFVLAVDWITPKKYAMLDFDWEYIVEGHYRKPGFALSATNRGEWNLYHCIPDQTMDHLHFYAEPMSLNLLKRIDETTKTLQVYSTVLSKRH